MHRTNPPGESDIEEAKRDAARRARLASFDPPSRRILKPARNTALKPSMPKPQAKVVNIGPAEGVGAWQRLASVSNLRGMGSGGTIG